MGMAYEKSASPLELKPAANPANPTASPSLKDAASYVKFTADVQAGVRYLIAAGDFDGSHELVTKDGRVFGLDVTNAQINAAVRWLRYVMKHKTGE